MENKNEKSMTLEEMISEMLKDAKVVKVPLPAKAEEKTEAHWTLYTVIPVFPHFIS